MRIPRVVKIGVVTLGAAGLLIQAVPYGRDHSNPPVRAEPEWPDKATRALVVAACFDCHSNQTKWPWYSHVAPMSWLVTRDVEDGREALNFSEWDRRPADDDAHDRVEDGSMPPSQYKLMHPDAKLSAVERERIIEFLEGVEAEEPEEPEEPDEDRSGSNSGPG